MKEVSDGFGFFCFVAFLVLSCIAIAAFMADKQLFIFLFIFGAIVGLLLVMGRSEVKDAAALAGHEADIEDAKAQNQDALAINRAAVQKGGAE